MAVMVRSMQQQLLRVAAVMMPVRVVRVVGARALLVLHSGGRCHDVSVYVAQRALAYGWWQKIISCQT